MNLGKSLLDFFGALQQPDPGAQLVLQHNAIISVSCIWDDSRGVKALEAKWPEIQEAARLATEAHYARIEELSKPFFAEIAKALWNTPY